jgi:hypothetical protein
MARMTPEQEAAYALRWNAGREGLPEAAKTEYDRLVAERAKAQDSGQPLPPIPMGHVIPARSSPEVRARILQLIKQANPKYAKPFERNRMAGFSLVGTESWAEYGQVVLQMAILDTLLSIEELLMKANGSGDGGEDEELQDRRNE